MCLISHYIFLSSIIIPRHVVNSCFSKKNRFLLEIQERIFLVQDSSIEFVLSVPHPPWLSPSCSLSLSLFHLFLSFPCLLFMSPPYGVKFDIPPPFEWDFIFANGFYFPFIAFTWELAMKSRLKYQRNVMYKILSLSVRLCYKKKKKCWNVIKVKVLKIKRELDIIFFKLQSKTLKFN